MASINRFKESYLKANDMQNEDFRHAQRAKQKGFSFSQMVFVIVMIFMFLPLLVLILYSFNSTKGMHWTSFSFVWYEKLFFNSRSLWQSFGNSIFIALSASLIATILGTAGAIGISWHRFKTRSYTQIVSYLPMVLPEIVMAIALLIFFSSVSIKLGLLTIIIAHVTFTVPFTWLMVQARLDEFDFTIIEAAHDLGADELHTLLRITLPLSLPGIVSGFLTAITISLENFVITFFVSGPGASTLTLSVYAAMKYGVSPVINAISVVMIIGTVILAYLFRNFLKYFVAK
ncbi:MAG: ABC transporter permease [Termitinemataceae bacterium]|nr:MAG: ABC transporter permease [Termitinemataceae bacterium]